jgi:DNA polymerase III epsilon subunit-like protein
MGKKATAERPGWDSVLWDEVPITILDTETTGFRSDDRICQITIAVLLGDEITESNTWLVNPERPISYEAHCVHGITDEMARKARPFRVIRDEVIAHLSRGPWAAHNLSFDARMLAKEIPQTLWPVGIPTLCTFNYAKHHHPATASNRSHKLTDLATAFNQTYKLSSLHNSEYDARLLAMIVRAMMKGVSIGSSFTKYSHEWIT